MDTEIKPVSESVSDEGRTLEVLWPDQHGSKYFSTWLDRQRFSESESDPISSPELNVWGAEMNGNIPLFDYSSLLTSDSELYEWLRTIQTTGIALIRGAPIKKGACRELTKRVAYMRRTIFGKEFVVEKKPNVSTLGNTTQCLALHTDLPYYVNPPDVQLLHCIEQCKGEGGESQFVDGWNIVNQLKEKYPDEYKILSTVPMDFKNAAYDHYSFHLKLSRPMIDFNLRGDLCMRYNDPIRAPYMLMPVEKVPEMYRTLKLLNHLIYHPQNLLRHRLSGGEIISFDNRRLLHGRSAFEDGPDSSRLLEGAYIEWDEVRSRMRVLSEHLFGIIRL